MNSLIKNYSEIVNQTKQALIDGTKQRSGKVSTHLNHATEWRVQGMKKTSSSHALHMDTNRCSIIDGYFLEIS